jgi:hypothetical protein
LTPFHFSTNFATLPSVVCDEAELEGKMAATEHIGILAAAELC